MSTNIIEGFNNSGAIEIDALTRNLVRRTCIGDVATRGARHYGDRPALRDGGVVITYRELDRHANAVARGLLAHGLVRGDRLAVVAANSWQFVVTYFACAKAGIVFLPINFHLSADEIAYQLNDSAVTAAVADIDRSRTLITAAGAVPTIRRLWVLGAEPDTAPGDMECRPWNELVEHDPSPVEVLVHDDDILHCLYTSGTTSAPKGVLTSHSAVLIAILSTALQMGHRRGATGSVMPIVLPMFHVTALDSLMMPVLTTGGTVLLHDGFDANVIAEEIEQFAVTHLVLIPMMWEALLRVTTASNIDTTSLRLGIYAMSPMSLERLDAIREAFPNADVVLASGQTETTPMSEMQWPADQRRKHGSWGSPSVTTDVAIMAPDGTLLPAGVEGEIVYRTPQLMTEYWANPQANQDAFAHGWFHSGDIGYLDDDGGVWFTDRLKDIVKTGGENVSSLEVEQTIAAHPDVLECAVVGTSHPRWGEAVTAFLVCDPASTPTEGEIIAFCKQRLAGYKVPKTVHVVDTLPKTATGKIEKHKLRRS